MSIWYIVETNPNCEDKATRELRRNGFRVYMPKMSKEKVNRNTGKRSIVFRPLLKGYLLVRFAGAKTGFGRVRDCQGVRRFLNYSRVGTEPEPFPISGAYVAELMRRQRAGEFGHSVVENKSKQRALRKERYQQGMEFEILDGLIAQIVGMRKTGEVEVTADLFGRPTLIVVANPEKQLREV